MSVLCLAQEACYLFFVMQCPTTKALLSILGNIHHGVSVGGGGGGGRHNISFRPISLTLLCRTGSAILFRGYCAAKNVFNKACGLARHLYPSNVKKTVRTFPFFRREHRE